VLKLLSFSEWRKLYIFHILSLNNTVFDIAISPFCCCCCCCCVVVVYVFVSFLEGDKVEKDIGRGHRWLRQAAQFKHAEAHYQLGASMISSGEPEQLSRGCDWIGSAAELGHEK